MSIVSLAMDLGAGVLGATRTKPFFGGLAPAITKDVGQIAYVSEVEQIFRSVRRRNERVLEILGPIVVARGV